MGLLPTTDSPLKSLTPRLAGFLRPDEGCREPRGLRGSMDVDFFLGPGLILLFVELGLRAAFGDWNGI